MVNVNFKCHPDIAGALDAIAAKNHEQSRHLVARRLVEESLLDVRQERIECSLLKLAEEIETLREDLASSLGILLVHGGTVATLEEARQWVRKTFYS